MRKIMITGFVVMLFGVVFADGLTDEEAEKIVSRVQSRQRLRKTERVQMKAELKKRLGTCKTSHERSVVADAAVSATRNGANVNEAVQLAVQARKQYRNEIKNGEPKKDAKSMVVRSCANAAKEMSGERKRVRSRSKKGENVNGEKLTKRFQKCLDANKKKQNQDKTQKRLRKQENAEVGAKNQFRHQGRKGSMKSGSKSNKDNSNQGNSKGKK